MCPDVLDPSSFPSPGSASKQETGAEKARREAREMTVFGLRQEDNLDKKLGWPHWAVMNDPEKVIDPRDKDAKVDLLASANASKKLEDNVYRLYPDPYTSEELSTSQKISDYLFNQEGRKQHYIVVEKGKMSIGGMGTADNGDAFKFYTNAIAQQISKHSDTLQVELGNTNMRKDFLIERLLIYVEIAQKNNLAINFGPDTQAFMNSLVLEDRKAIDEAVGLLRLNKERTNLIVGAAQDFQALQDQVSAPKPWEPPAGTANKAAWVQQHIADEVYGGKRATLSDQEKADALNKQLNTLNEELKEAIAAQKEVDESLKAYETMLGKPALIEKLPEIEFKYKTKWTGFLSRLGLVTPEIVKQQEKHLTDAVALVDQVEKYNENNKANREALLTELEKKRENLEQYRQELLKEVTQVIADVNAKPIPLTEPEKAALKKLQTQLEATEKQIKEMDGTLKKAEADNKITRKNHNDLEGPTGKIAKAKQREEALKAAAAAKTI